jgi:hypothetical protein
MGTAAPTAGTTIAEAAVRATSRLATGGEP